MSYTISFIGAGSMGGAIVRAVCRATAPENVCVYAPSGAHTLPLQQATGCRVAASPEEAIERGHFIVLAIKPNMVGQVLEPLLPALARAPKKVIVSIAGGLPIRDIRAMLARGGLSLPVIRLMPNTPVAVGCGLTLAATSEDTPEVEYQALCDLLRESGSVERLSEALLDIATPVSGSAPAFAYMFIDALADGGVAIGLPREKALCYAAQAVMGAAATVLRSGAHPGALKDAVCSPGGSTIVGVQALEKHGLRAAAADAIVSAYGKNCQLAE